MANAKYWTDKNYEDLKKAKNFPDCLKVAYDVIDSIGGQVGIVSGPISTGGQGSVEKNLAEFSKYIETMEKRGEIVFNQLPFENKFAELARNSEGYFMPILEDFFLPLFQSGKISKIWFMPNWQTSTGAKWEFEIADKLKIEKGFINL